MANFYTEASFIIPCNSAQAAIAINSLVHITDQFSDFAELAVFKADSEKLSPEELIIRHCFFNHPEQEKDNSLKELPWAFDVKPSEDGLWVHANESMNTEHAAVFTQALLNAFNLPSLVVIEAAHTCSKASTFAFGGHACVVSKDFIRWHGLTDFVNAEMDAHRDGERFYMCMFTEVNGETENINRFLMKCSTEDDPEKRLDYIFVNNRGAGGEKESDDFVWYCDGTAAKNPHMNEITPYEFKAIEKYFSVL
ncbi:hypothetical protein OCF84_21335 (plasmid) [Shewanella xiamenensis]|uniref:Uncharacterized protein n=1 Tax=Shewanella xiamenensis TaxID=332186 RepID=A0ABT6UDM8_9GAMM|nr:hypothetical protein [Shewanella xiamenensis]MDI5832579.1 hypothetical protein [Shewanella xiamenensis]WHF57803.1 hypothetical protein OCF84_21335 [Shewanella xiamenensis]